MQLRHCPRNDWCPSLQTWLRATTVAGAKLAMERCSAESLVPLHSTRKLRSPTWLMAQRDKQKKSSVNDAGLVCPHRSGAGSDDRLLSSSWALGDCSVTETMGRDSVEPLQVREEQDPCPANMR